MLIELTKAQIETIGRRARAASPNECCGFLAGTIEGGARRVSAVWPARNEAAPGRFFIPPGEVWRSVTRSHEGEERIVGVYHSHVGLPPVPSPEDLAHAWRELVTLIVSLRGGAAAVGAWRLAGDRFRTVEIRLAERGGGG